MVDAMGEFQDDEVDRAERAELVRRMRTEGGLLAYETCLKAMESDKVSWNVKAQVARSILDAGGFFRTTAHDETVPKDPATMTAAELEQAIAQLKAPNKQSASAFPEKSLESGNVFD